MNLAGLALTAEHPAGALRWSIFSKPSDMSKLLRPLIVKQLKYDLTPVAGLALVGHYLRAVPAIFARLDTALPVRGGVSNGDILRSYLGLLVQGKSDFDAIENFRGDAFYKQALGIALLPSSPTLRQRLDARAAEMFDFIAPLNEALLSSQRPNYGVLPCGWLPLDVDTLRWTTAARPRKAWAAPMQVSTATARWRPTWVRTGFVWNWRCARACSIRPARPTSTWSA